MEVGPHNPNVVFITRGSPQGNGCVQQMRMQGQMNRECELECGEQDTVCVELCSSSAVQLSLYWHDASNGAHDHAIKDAVATTCMRTKRSQLYNPIQRHVPALAIEHASNFPQSRVALVYA